MKSTLLVGDYLFVHAGVRPGVSLEDQSAALTRLREKISFSAERARST